MNNDASLIPYMDREFFDIETYAIFSALNEIVPEKAWNIAQRAGEYAFEEVKSRLGIKEKDPIKLIKILGNWLQDMGYARIEVKKIGENIFHYYMYDTASRKGLRKIREEKGKDAIMAHWSSVLMFAALKDMCNLKAEISHLDFAEKDDIGATIEEWVLSEIS